MELIKIICSVFLVLFFIYTFFFMILWIVSLFLSSLRLCEHSNRRKTVKMVIPDELAKKYPVSVIVPAYNEASCINETIESLLNEDYPALNILVVNDGSKDNTIETVVGRWKLKEISPEYKKDLSTQKVLSCYKKEIDGKNLFLINKENGGKADSLNCGLNFCTSPYCVIVDADTKVERGSMRAMVASFLKDKSIVVCAGVVGSSMYGTQKYKDLSFSQKALVLFQQLEYYRTFYMQRILFDRLNANVVVSGAFAMFDAKLVKTIGGYRVGTIGEDMELTMRIHAYCQSQKRKYRIAYDPEIKCSTQMPFKYSDFFQQRRRWHIGMIQSLKRHNYMLGSKFYGWAGFISSTYILLYELFAPFIELIGLSMIILSLVTGTINLLFTAGMIILFAAFAIVTQLDLILMLKIYDVEKISIKEGLWIWGVAIAEPIIFHPLNLFIKLQATAQSRKQGNTWKHIERA